MGRKQYINICTRLVLVILSGIIIYYSVQNQLVITASGFSAITLFQIYLLLDYLQHQFADIEKSIDCLLNDDYSNVLSDKKRENPLHNKTALLHKKYRNAHLEKSSEQLIFDNIIESLSIGILILKREDHQNIQVYKVNNAFANFLKIPKHYQWDLLHKKITPLVDVIDLSDWKSVKHVVSLTINDELDSFFLKTSVTNTYGCEYLILTLETVQQLIDKKEKESWYKLMNVMSHEIINTITPISSLSGNLETLLKEEISPDEEMYAELSHGLHIINKRSAHLTEFVETYRKLTELPQPKKESFDLAGLITQTLDLFASQFEDKKVHIEFEVTQNHILPLDQHQIEQVFINLFSNSLNAFCDTENPQIHIEIQKDKLRTQVQVTDNGTGISPEIKDKIFVPYFTTRKNGSGIGLTLSKSIMEAHGGGIYLKQNDQQTSFILVFTNATH